MAHDTHHEFETVVEWMRLLRARGTHGTTELRWRGQEIVYVEHHKGFQPGELDTEVQRLRLT